MNKHSHDRARVASALVKLGVALAMLLGSAADALAAPGPTPPGIVGPCNPAPILWASDYGNLVHGFSGTFSETCWIQGSPGLGFNQTQGLATDGNGNLYVADAGNKRIVVFSKTGIFLEAFSTNSANGGYTPHGVCVSRKGIIGVAGTPVANGSPASVEFFRRGGTLVGYATFPQFNGALFCAFDKYDNFFADGTAQRPAGQNIFYVMRSNVTTMGTPLMLSNVGNSAYWLGLYSANSGGNTLSAASVPITGPGCSYSVCEIVRTWTISGNGGLGPITLTFQRSCNMVYYPGVTNGVRQIAPNAVGKLFAADFGDSQVVKSNGCVNNNGSVASTTFAQGAQYFGIALYPTGQY